MITKGREKLEWLVEKGDDVYQLHTTVVMSVVSMLYPNLFILLSLTLERSIGTLERLPPKWIRYRARLCHTGKCAAQIFSQESPVSWTDQPITQPVSGTRTWTFLPVVGLL